MTGAIQRNCFWSWLTCWIQCIVLESHDHMTICHIMIHENPISYWYFFSMLFSSITLPGSQHPTICWRCALPPLCYRLKRTSILPKIKRRNLCFTQRSLLLYVTSDYMCYVLIYALCVWYSKFDYYNITVFVRFLSKHIYIDTSYKPWLLASNAPYPNLPKCTERSNSKALESTQLPTERRKKSKKPLLASPRTKPLRKMRNRSRCGVAVLISLISLLCSYCVVIGVIGVEVLKGLAVRH